MIKLDGHENSPACIPNIGPNERRRRLTFGIISLVVGAAIGLFFILSGWAWWTRLILFFPFMSGFVGIFQAREKTWVALAGRGLRNMDTGIEKIEDTDVLAQVRQQARKVYIKSFIWSIVLTVIVALLPIWLG